MRLLCRQKVLYGINRDVNLLFRLSQGYVATGHSDEQLPISWFFFTGGAYSVRGFAYNSIGADPDVTGEQNSYLYTGSVELQRRLTQDIFGIAFVDAGDAAPSLQDSRPSVSVGSGLLWQSFIGDLEVSVAKPLRNYSSDLSHRMRLNIKISQPI